MWYNGAISQDPTIFSLHFSTPFNSIEGKLNDQEGLPNADKGGEGVSHRQKQTIAEDRNPQIV